MFGKKYSLIAYLFFIKDKSKYLPIVTNTFDNSFKLLGSDFKTSHKCSWQNYCQYINHIQEIKDLLQLQLSSEVSILNAHSFTYMLTKQMKGFEANISEYTELAFKDRESVVKSRIGQGLYRDNLIRFWGECAVTGCKQIDLLIASHIKPWKDSDVFECRDHFNGLLLSPNLDSCFDKGFISFNNKGHLLLSKEFCAGEARKLGVHQDLKLSKITTQHQVYLAYHRKNIFRG